MGRNRVTLIDDVALRVRSDAAWRTIGQVDEIEQRVLLLSYVVWPTRALDEASRARARAELVQLRGKVG